MPGLRADLRKLTLKSFGIGMVPGTHAPPVPQAANHGKDEKHKQRTDQGTLDIKRFGTKYQLVVEQFSCPQRWAFIPL